MPAAKSIRELRRVFRATTSGRLYRWRRILANAWYRTHIARTATAMLCGYDLPSTWRDDLVHAALMLLRDDLIDGVDLRLDLRTDIEFGRTVRRLITRHCRKAIRQLPSPRVPAPAIVAPGSAGCAPSAPTGVLARPGLCRVVLFPLYVGGPSCESARQRKHRAQCI
jgi:hypothetical protein